MAAASSGCSIRQAMLQERASLVRAVKNPFSACNPIPSGSVRTGPTAKPFTPPTFVETKGNPVAMASIKAQGVPSFRDVSNAAFPALQIFCMSSCQPRSLNLPQPCSSRSSLLLSTPSPTTRKYGLLSLVEPSLRNHIASVRRKRQLNPAGHVLLSGGAQERDQPSLILHECIDTPVGSDLPQETCAGIALRAAAREREQRTGLGCAITELQGGHRGKMVGGRGLVGPSVTSGLVAEQYPLVGVGIVIAGIEVEEG